MYVPGYSTSPLQSASANARLLLEGFHTVFFDELKEGKEVYSKIFDVQKSDKRSEVVFEMVGLGMAPQANDGGPTEFEDMVNGGSRETIHLDYRKGYRVTAATLEDDLYGITKQGMKQLPRAFKRRVESLCAGIVAGTFTTTKGLDPVTAAGVALCSTSHNYASGKYDAITASATWSNRPASDSAPTPETIQSLMIQGSKLRTREGFPMDTDFNTVICPPDLTPTFYKIFNTDKKPFSNENTKNLFASGSMWNMDVIEWKWLTSTTAWWILDKEQSPFVFYWRVKPYFDNDYDNNNHVHQYFGRMRCSADAYEPRGILGTTGA